MSPRGLSWLDRKLLRLPPLARRGAAWVHDFWITTLVLIACGLLVFTAVKQRDTAREAHATAAQARATAIQAAELSESNRRLIVSNRELLAALQRSRIESCKRTYEGVREIFRPFFPPRSRETPTQRRNRIKFNRRVDRLKARCPRQAELR